MYLSRVRIRLAPTTVAVSVALAAQSHCCGEPGQDIDHVTGTPSRFVRPGNGPDQSPTSTGPDYDIRPGHLHWYDSCEKVADSIRLCYQYRRDVSGVVRFVRGVLVPTTNRNNQRSPKESYGH